MALTLNGLIILNYTAVFGQSSIPPKVMNKDYEQKLELQARPQAFVRLKMLDKHLLDNWMFFILVNTFYYAVTLVGKSPRLLVYVW